MRFNFDKSSDVTNQYNYWLLIGIADSANVLLDLIIFCKLSVIKREALETTVLRDNDLAIDLPSCT
jgi:hypothetical protein